MSLRVRLSLTSLEERETPSGIPGPVGPSGTPEQPIQTGPAQTSPPTQTPTIPPCDPHDS